ncbi:MAG: IclR family transcriptional regulator [Actinomycetota bacterium]|nr:IclR family transcriptional regulator [Actinomycetota bacterium]
MQKISKYGIGSVENALELLLMLSKNETVGVSEVADAVGIAPSSAHRLLKTLCSCNFAIPAAHRRYSRGPAFFWLGEGSIQTQKTLRRQLGPWLDEITKDLGETSHLVVLEGCSIRFLKSVEANRDFRVNSRAGRLFPAHRTSSGKALLSSLSDEEVFDLYSSYNSAIAKEVLSGFDQFIKELEKTRQQGFGLNLEESEAGLVSISACVKTWTGRQIAAFSVSMPTIRLKLTDTDKIGRKMIEYASKAEANLGMSGRVAR